MADREQVLHVAWLAKLALSPEQEERLGIQLAQILKYVDQLQEIDVDAEERSHGVILDGTTRGDDPAPGLPREQILALAPKADRETFRVPAVIDGGPSA